jgi:aminoacylase
MALHNLRETLNRIEEFRTVEFEKLKSGKATDGEVVSINNVFLKAGTATPTGFVMNLQPSEAEAGFDMRLPPVSDPDHLEKLLLEEWAPASRNLTVNFITKQGVKNKFGVPAVTIIDDTNPWWGRFKAGVANAGGNLGKPEILMGSTDARWVRFQGISAFGFSPMTKTPFLLHDENEFLHLNEYLKGITVYEEIIKSLTGPNSEEATANTESSKQKGGKVIDGVHTQL